ncbi:ABC-three component system middle component 1 [Paenibacillus sp. FSL E2-0202]|uniref:ABC-three component system middle component 1 n=1 Tax=Paenibacillus sp. FSL E2-0202 TaxID=2954505 RepID=UPI0030EC0D53
MYKTVILAHLISSGFKPSLLKSFEDTEFSLFTKGQFNVILRQSDGKPDPKSIVSEANFLRQTMHKNKLNAWNSYLIISSEEPMSFSEVFMIERNAEALRKYVVQNDNDLLRIPFLDNTETVKNLFDISSLKSKSQNVFLNNIQEFLLENNGANEKINPKVIQEQIDIILYLEGTTYGTKGNTN